jgi:diguanylate cyclase (GGDEF)-like protein
VVKIEHRDDGPPRRWLIAAIIPGCALIAGLGLVLANTQNNSRDALEQDFGAQARLVSRSVAATMTGGSQQGLVIAQQVLGGSRPEIATNLALWQAANGGGDRRLVLDGRGRILAAVPALDATARRLAQLPALRVRPADGARVTDVIAEPGEEPAIGVVAPYDTFDGQRVFFEARPAAGLGSFFAGCLGSASAIAGARAYLLDGHNVVISAVGSSAPIGRPLDWPQLTAAMARHQSGALGSLEYTSAPVLPGTNWHVVFVAPMVSLYAPLASSHGASWGLFGGFVAALLLAIALGARSLRRTGQLLRARAQARSAEEVAYQRLHDELTGLPNRTLFIDRIELALAAQRREPRPLAVMFVDLDRFKRVNDSLGHAAGDVLLRTMAARLQETLRPTDTVSRFGGDEFVLLCPGVTDATQASLVAARLEQAIEQPISLGRHDVRMTAAIGIALWAPDEAQTDAASLIRDADAAMYRAKRSGPGAAQLFDVEMHHEASDWLGARAARD